ncbi:MAG: FAD-binding oxidoreductase [Actinomycetota bacterium]|nr:FAD-binding oxidoreductase [Actinomycetota bacterium]
MHTKPARSHDDKVEQIAVRLSELARASERVHIDKGGVHHVVPVPKDKRFASRPFDVSSLTDILEIDRDNSICVAEAGVSFGRIVEATLPLGLMPVVVPELEGITLGGAVAGCSIESTSYRHGGFHDTCLEYEIVTGDGRILTCSRESEPLIFEMIHGSYGTLGLLTKLTFKLIPAKPYVRMDYRRFSSATAFLAEVRDRCETGDFDFVDGIVHAPNHFVLCLGSLCDTAPGTSDYRASGPYYKSTADRDDDDYLRTRDYLFRYDADAHWLTRAVPPLEWGPVRRTIGRGFLGSTNLIKWSRRLERIFALKKRPDVVVDVFIPSTRFEDFCSWYEAEMGFFPLWTVPYRMPEPYPWLSAEQQKRLGTDLIIDCAVYGMRNNHPRTDYSLLIEEKTFELGGVKTLISRNHYSRERFWQIYNESNYNAVKEKTDPHAVFADLFEKFHQVG